MAQKGHVLYFLKIAKAALLWFVLKFSIEVTETVALSLSPWENTGQGGVKGEQTVA